MFPAAMRPALALALMTVVGRVATAHADDLPSELVARPATLPRALVALTLAGGYDSAHVLGISVLSATTLGVLVQRGMTSRLELSLETSFGVQPDAGWTRDGSFAMAYRAWQRDAVELVPAVMVPLSFRSGADITSTIVLGAGLRWRAGSRILVVVGQRLLPLPLRPAVALDLGADVAVTAQLAERWATIAQVVLGEVTVVGQTDRGVAPWHHLASLVRLVYATPHAIDIALEVHGDARDPRNEAGVVVSVTRRM
ncbi:MAG TPA: hypothetical protein VFT22_10410 [Kofleriaceae bacterium]|nr:hypothetical protein [Kofleriaceae bacterium]